MYSLFKLRYFDSEDNKVVPWKFINEKIPHSRSKKNKGHLTMQGCINLHNKTIRILKQILEKKYGEKIKMD